MHSPVHLVISRCAWTACAAGRGYFQATSPLARGAKPSPEVIHGDPVLFKRGLEKRFFVVWGCSQATAYPHPNRPPGLIAGCRGAARGRRSSARWSPDRLARARAGELVALHLTLHPTVLQERLGAQGLELIARALDVHLPDQPVQPLDVGRGVRMLEVAQDVRPPVADRVARLLERPLELGRHIQHPLRHGPLSGGSGIRRCRRTLSLSS